MPTVGELDARLTLLTAEFEKMARKVDSIMAGMGKTMSRNLGDRPTKAINKTEKQFSRLVWTADSGVKAISRVVTGILISQTFYRLIGTIQEATRELWQFNVEMEQTELAFEILFNSAEQGAAFVDMLEDFAAITPFVMENTTSMARQLLAVGFSARETLIVMKGVVDSMAIMGARSDQLGRLVDAISRIKAVGAELRYIKSIGKAGIPIYDILKKQLGVTEEQIRSGYLLSLPRATVITAILKGIQEAFKDGAIKLSRTVGGLMSTIQDNLLLIGRGVLEPIYEIVKDRVGAIADRLQGLRNAMRKYGIGGMFEALVPPRLQEDLRLLVAYLLKLVRTLAETWKVTAPIRREMLNITLLLGNMLLPVLITVKQGILLLGKAMASSQTAARAFAGALMTLTTALLFFKSLIIRQPWLLVLFAIGGALLSIASASATVSRWLDILRAKFLGFFGLDTSKILQPILQETGEVDLDTTIAAIGDAYDDLEEDIEGATEAMKKFILPFDEVYRILEDTDTSQIEFPDIGELEDIGTLDFEIPEVEFMEDMFGNLEINFKDILERLKNMWLIFWHALVDIAKQILPNIFPTIMATLPRVFKTVFSLIWQLVKTYYTKIFPTFAQTILKTTWNILRTLPTLIWPLLKTALTVVTSLLKTLTIVIPKAIETVSKAMITLVEAVSSYGLDRIGVFITNMAVLLGKSAYHLGNIAILVGGSIGGALGSAIGNAAMAALETLMIDIAALFRQQLFEPFKHLGFDIPFIDQLEGEFDKIDREMKEAISKRATEQTQIDVDWWTSGIPEAIAEESKALEGVFGEMAGLVEQEYNNFITETTPIWENLGTDIGGIWEGSLSDLANIWGPALGEIETVWTDWFDTSATPIWEGYGEDIKEIWGLAFEGIADDFNTWKEDEGTKIWEDYGADINKIWGDSLEEIPKIITETKSGITKEFGLLLGDLVGDMDTQTKAIKDSATAITEAVQATEEPIATSMENNKKVITTSMEDIVDPVKEAGEDAALGYNDEWESVVDNELTTTFGKIDDVLLEQKQTIVNVAKEIAEAAVDAMDIIFKNFHPSIVVDVEYNIPNVNIPGISTPKTAGMPPQPLKLYPKTSQGGVALSHQIRSVSEGNKRELIQPLSEYSLRPFAEALMNVMGNKSINNFEETTPIYVGTLIADRKGIKELERRRYEIRRSERMRGVKY